MADFTFCRSDRFRILLSVPGVTTLPGTSWTTFEGGDLTVEATNLSPGGSQPNVDIGGRRTRSPITLTRPWQSGYRVAALDLDDAGGILGAVVTLYTLDATKKKVDPGTHPQFTGSVGNVTYPKGDSNTSPTPSLFTVVINCDEVMRRVKS